MPHPVTTHSSPGTSLPAGSDVSSVGRSQRTPVASHESEFATPDRASLLCEFATPDGASLFFLVGTLPPNR